MIILIGNQKGGPGKSTIAMLLANYLTQVRTRQVTLIDMDYQQSIVQMSERAKILDSQPPYEVIAANLEQFEQIKSVLSRNREMIFLIDLPGKLDDDGLIPLFRNSDLVLCPFAYSELSFDSTILFSIVLRKIKPNVVLTFIPNRIKSTVNYRTKSDVEAQLLQFGKITPAIPDRIDFQRITTVSTPSNIQAIILPIFDQLYTDHIHR